MFLKRKGNRATIDIIKQVDSFPFNFHLIGPKKLGSACCLLVSTVHH